MADLTSSLSVGERLFLRRRRLGWSQREAARHMKVSRTKYGRYERDQEECPVGADPIEYLTDNEQATILRRREGLTQKDVADEIGMSRYWVSKMETGGADAERIKSLMDDRASA